MSVHARLSASSAHRWMPCPGSVKLCEPLENAGSRHAAEGTFAHEIAAAALNNVQPPDRWLGKKRIVDDKYEIECTPEMIEAVKFYVDSIDEELNGLDKWHVEVDLTPELSKLHPDLGGTADFMRYRPSKKHLRVVDLKYGAGVMVEVEDNVQALTYALGALLALKQPCSTVTVAIIQPRIEHPDGRIREWTFPSVDLLAFKDRLVDAAEAANKPDAPLVPGEKQCRFCPAKASCPALKARQQMVMAAEFSPDMITPEKVVEALSLIPAVKARLKALEELAYELAAKGIITAKHGWKLVDKRPTRKWRSEGDVIMWAQSAAVDPYAPRELLSPPQLEKKIMADAPKGSKKAATAVLAPFIESVSSGQVLVPLSDERPEAKRITAADFEATAEKKALDLF